MTKVIRDMIDMRASGIALRKIAAVSEHGFQLSHEAVKKIVAANTRKAA